MTTLGAKVIVVGGDPVMGRALAALMQAAGYEGLFQPEPLEDGLGELLADARLLLVAPGLNAESRGTLADAVMSPPTNIPVLELVPANGGEMVGLQGVDAMPWPCAMEELRRRVRAAVLLAQEG